MLKLSGFFAYFSQTCRLDDHTAISISTSLKPSTELQTISMASASPLHFWMTNQFPSTSYIPNPNTNPNHRLLHIPAISVNLRQLSSRCSVVTCARRRSSKSNSAVPSSKKKKVFVILGSGNLHFLQRL